MNVPVDTTLFRTRPGSMCYFIDIQELQLREVSQHFGITVEQDQLMSRCPKCNAAAFRLVPQEHVAARVPERVLGIVEEFFECGACLQVFWMVSLIDFTLCLRQLHPTPAGLRKPEFL